MPDYKSMYFRLFNRVSEAIELLQSAQQESENSYIESKDEPKVYLVDVPNDDEE